MGPELGHGGMHGHSGTWDKPKHVRIRRNPIENSVSSTHEPAQSSIEDEFVVAVSITDDHTLVITRLPGSTRAPLCVFGWGEVECNCFPATARDPVPSEYTPHYMPSQPTWDGVPWLANGPFHPSASIYISDWSRFVRDNDDRTLIVKYTQFSHGPIHPSTVLQSTDGRSTLIDGRVIGESDTSHGKLRLLTKRPGVQLELNELRAIWADQAAYA